MVEYRSNINGGRKGRGGEGNEVCGLCDSVIGSNVMGSRVMGSRVMLFCFFPAFFYFWGEEGQEGEEERKINIYIYI